VNVDVYLFLFVLCMPFVFVLGVFGFLAAIVARHLIETRCGRSADGGTA
jgi:hypothetical protein